jgi:hypothetical protein
MIISFWANFGPQKLFHVKPASRIQMQAELYFTKEIHSLRKSNYTTQQQTRHETLSIDYIFNGWL